MLGLIGKKIGMTQMFDDSGNLKPVTAVRVEPNTVVAERSIDENGYSAVVLGAFAAKKTKKPVAGQFPKGVEPTKVILEIRDYERECKIGEKIGVEIFEDIPFVDIEGTSKGKGNQGVIKRHGFRGGRKTHGSKFHRTPGSTGMAAWPSRVIKGTKMAGRMGGQKTTVQNLSLLRVDQENGVLFIGGCVPGTRGSLVVVRKAEKK